MKKVYFVLLIAALALLVGCGMGEITPVNLTPESFTVHVGDFDFILDKPVDLESELRVALKETILYDDDGAHFILTSEGAHLGCGLAVGDDVDKMIQTLGKNKGYDKKKRKDEYIVTFYYYIKDSQLFSLTDKINMQHLRGDRMTAAEKKVYEHIRDDYMYNDGYMLNLYIKDGVIDEIWMYFREGLT